jgi:hypothetical protein
MRMDQIEPEVAEEELLAEARQPPLGLACLCGDLPGRPLVDVRLGLLAHADRISRGREGKPWPDRETRARWASGK